MNDSPEISPSTKNCFKCNSTLDIHTNFCGNCGTKFGVSGIKTKQSIGKQILRGILWTFILLGGLLAYGAWKVDRIPNIDVQCTMNGFGQGHCIFTNSGKGDGSSCGSIHVYRTDGKSGEASSEIFCSKNLEPQTSAEITFGVPATDSICKTKSYSKSWKDVCAFEFNKQQ